MASVYPCNGYLYLSYTDAQGKRRQVSLKLKDTKANRKRAEEKRKRVEAELRVDPVRFTAAQTKMRTRMHLSAVVKMMMDEGYDIGKSKSTIRNLQLALKKFMITMGDKTIDAIDVGVMAEFQRGIEKTDGATNTGVWLRHLSPVFSYARRKGMVESNPITQEMRDYGKKARRVILLPTDRDKILQRGEERYGREFVRQLRFLMLTGWRPEECCRMKRFWIEYENGLLAHYNGKGERLESFPLYDKLYELLADSRSLGSDEYVFKYRSATTLSHYFSDCVTKLKLNPNYTLYVLRKTFSTALVKGKVHPARHQRLMGHIDYRTTQDYYNYWDVDALREDMESVGSML